MLRSALSIVFCLLLSLSATHAETMRVGLYGFPLGLGNPHRSTSMSEWYFHAAVYDGLTQIGYNNTPEPALATSWGAVDELTWHFKLREGVTFHNGVPLTAQSVADVINFLVSPEAAREGIARELKMLDGAGVVDPLTVEIRTKWPTLILPRLMSVMRIHEHGAWQALGMEGFMQAPVGTGPFRVVRFGNARAYLEGFADSWRPPKVDKLEMLEILDARTRVQGILSGDLHIIIGNGPEEGDELEAAGHVSFVDHGGGVLGFSYILPNPGPIQNLKVRQALNYAIDRQAYIDVLLRGKTRPASQATPHSANGFDPSLQPFPYDPAKARKLLKEAGYKRGFKLIVEAAIGGSANDIAIFQFVGAQLAEIGVQLEIRPIPVSELIRKAVNGGWDGQAFAMDFDTNITRDAYRPLPMHSCLRRVYWYCDETVVPWLEAAERSFDPEERTALIQKVLNRYHEAPPMLFLHETVQYDGLHKRVRGYKPKARIINFHEVYLAN